MPTKTNAATTQRVRGRPFEKGNPGRPPGSRNKVSRAVEAMLDGQAEAITSKVVELALAGDRVAMRLCWDRVLAVRPGRSVSLDLPVITSAADAASAMSIIIATVASGEITPSEAEALSRLVDATARVIETRDLHQRIDELERRSEFRNRNTYAKKPKDYIDQIGEKINRNWLQTLKPDELIALREYNETGVIDQSKYPELFSRLKELGIVGGGGQDGAGMVSKGAPRTRVRPRG